MKISLEALKRYVEINVPVEELCDRMVMAGFEIEEMEKQGENIKNVVAAKILKITPHENSEAPSQTVCSARAANCVLPRRITRAPRLTAYLF